MTATVVSLGPFPLVGRDDELADLQARIERARSGPASVVLLQGERGVGRSRLAAAVAEESRRRGWRVVLGRAYPVETGVPFALFADGIVPLLNELGRDAVVGLTRGGDAGLQELFPAFRGTAAPEGDGLSATSKTQLFWDFSQFVRNLAQRSPLLLVLEDLHSADPPSLELLHFTARQIGDVPVAILATYDEGERGRHPTLGSIEESLLSMGAASNIRIGPLSGAAVHQLLQVAFGVDAAVSSGFSERLWEWTGGNPFLAEEVLRTLMESGRLYWQGGVWLGWETTELEVPRSTRQAVLARVGRLTPVAREMAELLATVGGRARYELIRAVSGRPDGEIATALEELTRLAVLVESDSASGPVYDFRQPIFRETVMADIGLARRGLLHAQVAEALERVYGESAPEHADELAFHYSRAQPSARPRHAIRYLRAAGHRALKRFSDREAIAYMEAALERTRVDPGAAAEDGRGVVSILDDLARARARSGDLVGAVALWTRAAAEAEKEGDRESVADVFRHMGLAHFSAGEHDRALGRYEAASQVAEGVGEPSLMAKILVPWGMCLHGVGRVQEAEEKLSRALEAATRAGSAGLLTRAHRSLLLLHTWSGPPDLARRHGMAAIELAGRTGDPALAGNCHWGMALLEGLGGHEEDFTKHLREADRLADELGSPLLRLSVAELQVEYAFGSGAWDRGLGIGESAIALGRSVGHNELLPRLLVWTGLIYLGRSQVDLAWRHIEEAWTVAGAGAGASGNVHAVVVAHIGVATHHMARGELDEAIRVASDALAIVDRTGYRSWAAHRLLPILAEAHLTRAYRTEGDLEPGRRFGLRLREEASVLEDALGLAWSDACDALCLWLEGKREPAVVALREAAEKLERVPFLPDALRLRRRLATCLAELGDRDAAVAEYRRIHDAFLRLGATAEIEKTRKKLVDLGSRPPTRPSARGAEGLTTREMAIVRLVAARRSTKAIARELGISARTVETHLTNIYKKLSVRSRAELAEVARALPGVA